MKFCVRNLRSPGMISIEKNFEKIEKKNFEIFPEFFRNFFFVTFRSEIMKKLDYDNFNAIFERTTAEGRA